MDNCKIIQDLLPSYCDQLTSEESNAFIQEHLNQCPQCKAIFEKMQAPVEPEPPDRREEFSKTLRMYEQRHQQKLRRILNGLAVAAFLAALVWISSYPAALLFSGLDFTSVNIVDEWPDQGDAEAFQVILSEDRQGNPALAILTRNKLGFWYVSRKAVADPQTNPVVQLSWTGLVSFGYNDIRLEQCELYRGVNAQTDIFLHPDQIPPNISVHINHFKGSNEYWLLVTRNEVDGETYDFDVLSALKENGCIS